MSTRQVLHRQQAKTRILYSRIKHQRRESLLETHAWWGEDLYKRSLAMHGASTVSKFLTIPFSFSCVRMRIRVNRGEQNHTRCMYLVLCTPSNSVCNNNEYDCSLRKNEELIKNPFNGQDLKVRSNPTAIKYHYHPTWELFSPLTPRTRLLLTRSSFTMWRYLGIMAWRDGNPHQKSLKKVQSPSTTTTMLNRQPLRLTTVKTSTIRLSMNPTTKVRLEIKSHMWTKLQEPGPKADCVLTMCVAIGIQQNWMLGLRSAARF